MSTANKDLRHILDNRINRLQGSICIIKIGGRNEVEQNELRDKLVDGMNAVRNSIKGGVCTGGGAALVHASRVLDFLELGNDEEQVGVDVLKRALREPFKKIVENSGENGAYYLQKVLESGDMRLGGCN